MDKADKPAEQASVLLHSSPNLSSPARSVLATETHLPAPEQPSPYNLE